MVPGDGLSPSLLWSQRISSEPGTWDLVCKMLHRDQPQDRPVHMETPLRSSRQALPERVRVRTPLRTRVPCATLKRGLRP